MTILKAVDFTALGLVVVSISMASSHPSSHDCALFCGKDCSDDFPHDLFSSCISANVNCHCPIEMGVSTLGFVLIAAVVIFVICGCACLCSRGRRNVPAPVMRFPPQYQKSNHRITPAVATVNQAYIPDFPNRLNSSAPPSYLLTDGPPSYYDAIQNPNIQTPAKTNNYSNGYQIT